MSQKLGPAADYPSLALRPLPPWWRRLFRKAQPACVHAGASSKIELQPDSVRLRNGAQATVRQPPRRPITVCPGCLVALLEAELKNTTRRVVAFEPSQEGLAAYSFIEQQHLGDSGLRAEDVIHCQSLVAEPLRGCQKCGGAALLLVVKRGLTTESGKLASFRGGKESYCLSHGSERLGELLRERLPRRPVDFFNFPYGERGVYVPSD